MFMATFAIFTTVDELVKIYRAYVEEKNFEIGIEGLIISRISLATQVDLPIELNILRKNAQNIEQDLEKESDIYALYSHLAIFGGVLLQKLTLLSHNNIAEQVIDQIPLSILTDDIAARRFIATLKALAEPLQARCNRVQKVVNL
jgi:hypothetical protein